MVKKITEVSRDPWGGQPLPQNGQWNRFLRPASPPPPRALAAKRLPAIILSSKLPAHWSWATSVIIVIVLFILFACHPCLRETFYHALLDLSRSVWNRNGMFGDLRVVPIFVNRVPEAATDVGGYGELKTWYDS